ncbi:peptidoglycan D,D-transpeptidase FtsI family protein [Elizabethkingia miricola]|uniref:Beta-lactamase n=1 Tax=Elizabethkingia miricola TaxID=172045 RepID=A0ABD5B798_ELIMR|nr:penicillin-binding transpeptidase domain-containing protein [Elizabethkingia miricola]MDQ8749279.1 penicillin-binding transpeptidase domain-containing protein [Elizabethkingia miricola]NHQ65538.1 peptidoglycan glycosyltransferase [Elizabethkingia miricola]NHQ68988.1 peptidoglycan glycosyltransferase [Elizabethkingia miricola]NHQ76200.1 peptidoglycan glycosyltransferase [Elizabethkingia miricola]OPB92017.1 peptidoglycan glycosyltransferase [Elizabethkingia miricola]
MKPYFRILAFISIIACIFVARLAYLQLFTDRYALNAANTSIKIEYVIPQRGVIFDRNGKIMVGNQPSFEISFTQALMKPDFDTISFCTLVGMNKTQFIQRIEEVKAEKYYSKLTPMTFIKDLGREDIARIQERIFKYPAFSIVSRPQRQYEINTSGNLLGYTNQVNPSYIKRDSTYYLPGDIAGMTGVEKSYEKQLRGVKGMKYIQKDIRLRNIGSYKDGKLDKQVVPGDDLTLTIDYDLQKIAEEMLVNKHGAIVAIDPNNGEILVLASGPDIDPNQFTGPEKNKNLYRLQVDTLYDNKPTFDRSLQAAYPPGSTFKLLTALAGMQMGVMDEKTVYPCGGGFNYRGLRIKGHGGADPLIPAIRVSSNCYFSYAFISIMNKYPGDPTKGVDEWKKIMNSFGVGEFLNNDLAVGSKGRIPSGEFYEKRSGTKNWFSDITRNGAIFNGMGQGDVLLTPLQMANAVAAIANKGWYITPHIVKLVNGKPNPDPRFKEKHKTLVDPKHFEPILKGMEQVVLAGTARSLRSSDFTQLAKTGTAQVPQGKDNSIFVLIAPADKPKIVVAAVMEHAGFGATWAGPAATVVAEKYITGELKREHLYKKMITSSFMPEYKRQWIVDLKRKGLYVEPSKQDSIQKKKKTEDSLKALRISAEQPKPQQQQNKTKN